MSDPDATTHPPVYDPMFDSTDADFELKSSDDTYYRIHAFILRTTSGFFRAMLTLPQQPNTPVESVSLGETSGVVGILLRMISGLEVPKWESLDDIEAVLNAAYKYDMPGPITTLRAIASSPPLLNEPLGLYVIATRFGWREEITMAAERTLTLSIHDEQYELILERIPTKPLLKLLNLHRKRRDGFRSLINSPERFTAENIDPTYHLCGEPRNNKVWRNLKSRMILEMERRPLGDTLLGTNLTEWPETKECWDTRCLACNMPLYQRATTIDDIKACLDLLPSWDPEVVN